MGAKRRASISGASSGGGGGGGGGGAAPYTILTGYTGPTVTQTPLPPLNTSMILPGSLLPFTENYLVAQSVTIVADNGTATLMIPSGAQILDQAGQPLRFINITRIGSGELPPVPPGAGINPAGYAYQIDPSGARYNPPLRLTITVSPGDWAALSGKTLSVRYYDQGSGTWQALPTTVDQAAGTVTVDVPHTTVFALFTETPAQATVPSTAAPTFTATTAAAPALPGGFDLMLVLRILVIAVIIVAAITIALFFYRKRKKPAEVTSVDEHAEFLNSLK